MFRGPSKVTLDAKGRMAIPTRYRERIAARCENHLVATVDRGCLLIYPLPDWEDIERKLDRLPALDKQARRLQRVLLGHAEDLEMDAQGRVLIPKVLREYTRIGKRAMLIGQGRKFELWDEEAWNARMDAWMSEDEDEDDGAPLSAVLETLTL
ncbi:MAG: division/cell wall cluster transcriptional repressor MraZ [Pseudomonadota bacterium]